MLDSSAFKTGVDTVREVAGLLPTTYLIVGFLKKPAAY